MLLAELPRGFASLIFSEDNHFFPTSFRGTVMMMVAGGAGGPERTSTVNNPMVWNISNSYSPINTLKIFKRKWY